MAERRRDPVRIALVFPSLLGTYGDGGNAGVLAQRLRWRGIDAETVEVAVDEAVPDQADVYVLGGGEDTAQTLAVSRLAGGALQRAVDAGKPVFAVCAGFQILGETFLDGRGDTHPGLGLIDCRTDRLPGPRAVGELLGEPAITGLAGPLTGYENHGGRTAARPGRPAARPGPLRGRQRRRRGRRRAGQRRRDLPARPGARPQPGPRRPAPDPGGGRPRPPRRQRGAGAAPGAPRLPPPAARGLVAAAVAARRPATPELSRRRAAGARPRPRRRASAAPPSRSASPVRAR